MPFPNLPDKYRFPPHAPVEQEIAYMRQRGELPDFPPPAGVVFCFQRALLRHIQHTETAELHQFWFGDLYLLRNHATALAIAANFGVGAPAAGIFMEFLIGLGGRRFITVGMGGALQPGATIGDVVVCSRAVRDEGLSHHYLPPSKYADPSPDLTARLANALTAEGVEFQTGVSWSCDAHYRETNEEFRQYRQEGILTVEMEAAGMAAVAERKGVEFTAAFVISDVVREDAWLPDYRAEIVAANLHAAYRAAVVALQ